MPDWLAPKAPTLPRFLRQAGYRTAHFGKWQLTDRDTHGSPRPEAYGYDEFAVFNGGAEWPSADLHATAANTVSFIKANKDKPFFINVWLHESHTPHVPTAASMEKRKHLDEQKQVYSAVITDGDNAVGAILDSLKAEGVAKADKIVCPPLGQARKDGWNYQREFTHASVSVNLESRTAKIDWTRITRWTSHGINSMANALLHRVSQAGPGGGKGRSC